MIKILKKFYKLAPNGKMELFGKDGNEHMVIDAFIMLISVLCSFYFNTYYITAVTFIVMRFVWFFIEQSQEKDMQKKDPTRKTSLWKFWKWSKARKVDMYKSIPFGILTTVVTVINV